MLCPWIKYMLEVPRSQELDAVHSGDRDVGGVPGLSCGNGLSVNQQIGKRLGLRRSLKQSDPVELSDAFRRGVMIARTAFVDDQI